MDLKKSESGFDTNKTNPFLSISIHFCLLEGDVIKITVRSLLQ